uniref:Uncharacterized protein n=1 Tax=Magallana gigas TaxID=29159 RepID=K1QKF6_MAGGI
MEIQPSPARTAILRTPALPLLRRQRGRKCACKITADTPAALLARRPSYTSRYHPHRMHRHTRNLYQQ